MNVLSLCSGIGGLDLGLERAGMTTVGQVEIDPFCQRVLAKHWPEVPRHDDVHTAVEWWRSGRRPRVDVVAGGFPCQPVSLAGKGHAQADERWLWPAVANVVRHLQPRYVLLENVPGLLGRGAGDVLGDLAALGYDAEWDCVPAAAVGATHIRDRWFCVAYPNGQQHEVGAHAVGRPSTEDVLADTQGVGRGARRPGRPAGDGADRTGLAPQELADAEGQRRWPRRVERAASRQDQWPPPVRGSWWATEPDVDRVAYGVPRGVDRLRGLGNAVVPQVAEHIGRLILAADEAA